MKEQLISELFELRVSPKYVDKGQSRVYSSRTTHFNIRIGALTADKNDAATLLVFRTAEEYKPTSPAFDFPLHKTLVEYHHSFEEALRQGLMGVIQHEEPAPIHSLGIGWTTERLLLRYKLHRDIFVASYLINCLAEPKKNKYFY